MNTDTEKFIRFCDSEFGRKVLKKEARYVYDKLENSEKILDVGCGIGSFEQNLPSLGIIGLDVSEEMLKEARKRSDKSFVRGDAQRLGFKDAAFDGVFTVTTLEFLDNYQKAVKEIARVTKPHGKIVAMMLNPNSEYSREEMKKPGDYFRRIKHTNPKDIRDYLSHFYTIIKAEYFLGIKGKDTLDTNDERYAGLYVVVGTKK